jgi:hypothetical protein
MAGQFVGTLQAKGAGDATAGVPGHTPGAPHRCGPIQRAVPAHELGAVNKLIAGN